MHDTTLHGGGSVDGEAARLHELVMDLVRAFGVLQDDTASEGRLSLSQMFALHEIDVHSPLSQRELGERLRLEKSSVSRLAADLERKGLIRRERDPGNRRLYRLRITDEGRDLHTRISASHHARYTAWTTALEPAEREALLTGLTALVRTMRGT